MNLHGEERLKPMSKNRQAGKGLFKPVTLSAPLAKVTGISGMAPRTEVTKALWAYIKCILCCSRLQYQPQHIKVSLQDSGRA